MVILSLNQKTRKHAMKNELNSILRHDFLAFASKAIRELEGTKFDHDGYLEISRY